MTDLKEQMPDLDFLDTLGTKKNTESISLNNIETVLFQFAEDFISQMQDNLERSGSISKGELSGTIKQKIKYANNVYTLQVSLKDYYDFINKGVSGTENKITSPYAFKNNKVSRKMAAEILAWIRRGKIKATHRDIKTYGTYGILEKKNAGLKKLVDESKNYKSLAFAVGVSIKKRGIKATHFKDRAFKSTYPELKKNLAKALKEDFRLVIRQINTE